MLASRRWLERVLFRCSTGCKEVPLVGQLKPSTFHHVAHAQRMHRMYPHCGKVADKPSKWGNVKH